MSVVYVGHRLGLDPALLWLWCRPAAKALIQPLAWELPYAASVALKSKEKEKIRKEKKRKSILCVYLTRPRHAHIFGETSFLTVSVKVFLDEINT